MRFAINGSKGLTLMSTTKRKSSSVPVQPLLTLEQIERLTGLSGSHLRRAIRSKELACMRFGRAIRVSEDDYLSYLARHRRGKRDPP
jgi:excisionase family DNA binding protein